MTEYNREQAWISFFAVVVAIGLATGPAKSGTGLHVRTIQHCPQDKSLDPYAVWKNISDERGAAQFLRMQFRSHPDIDSFSIWLRCQDFSVRLIYGPMGGVKLDAIYMAAGKSRKPLWYRGWLDYFFPSIVWSHGFGIHINQANEISRIGFSWAVE